MQYTVAAVGSFASEQEPVAFPVELRAPFDKFLDGSRTFFHERAHRRGVAEPVARGERIRLVEFHLVVIA